MQAFPRPMAASYVPHWNQWNTRDAWQQLVSQLQRQQDYINPNCDNYYLQSRAYQNYNYPVPALGYAATFQALMLHFSSQHEREQHHRAGTFFPFQTLPPFPPVPWSECAAAVAVSLCAPLFTPFWPPGFAARLQHLVDFTYFPLQQFPSPPIHYFRQPCSGHCFLPEVASGPMAIDDRSEMAGDMDINGSNAASTLSSWVPDYFEMDGEGVDRKDFVALDYDVGIKISLLLVPYARNLVIPANIIDTEPTEREQRKPSVNTGTVTSHGPA